MSATPIKKKNILSKKKVKNWILSLAGLGLIFLAISFSIVRILINYIPDYKIAIQEAALEQLGVHLVVQQLDAEIHWLVPHLKMINVDVQDGLKQKKLIHINEVDLSLDWVNTLKTGIPAISEVTLDGMNLQIGVNKKSQLIVQDYVVNNNVKDVLQTAEGFDESDVFKISDELKYLINNLNFNILNSNIRLYHAKNTQYNKVLSDFNLRLINDNNEHVFEIETRFPEEYGEKARFIVTVEGDVFDFKNLEGNAYFFVSKLNLSPWLKDYWKSAWFLADAKVSAEYWLSWKGKDVTNVVSRFEFSEMLLRYLDKPENSRRLDKLTGVMQWQKQSQGWMLAVRDLKSDQNDKVKEGKSSANIEMRDDGVLKVTSDFIRIESLSYLAGMVFSLDKERVSWVDMLETHQPTGLLKNMEIEIPIEKPEDIKVNTEFEAIGFSVPEASNISIHNIQGSIIYYGNETWLALDSDNAFIKVDEMFRHDLMLTRLQGVVKVNYKDDILHVESDAIQIDTPHVKTENRINIRLSENSPFMDFTSRYREGYISYTKNYLPVGIMNKETVSWLDSSFKSGVIKNGSYQFYGDFKDFPFREYEGVSIASFDAEGVALNYLKTWPVIHDVAAKVRIENESLQVNINHGHIYSSVIKNASASIASFTSPILDLTVNVENELVDIPRYLMSSGLKVKMPEYINNVQLAGSGLLHLELFIPLYGRQDIEWGGRLDVIEGGLKLKNEKYELTNIKGDVRFANAYFEIPDMQAMLDNEPLNITLKTRKQDGVTVYGFKANGELKAQSLLAPLPDYQKYISGKSDFNIAMDVYSIKDGADLLLDVDVVSSLQGAESVLPAGLSKAAGTVDPVKLSVQLYKNTNVKFDLRYDNGGVVSLHEFPDYWLLMAELPAVKGVVNLNKQKKTRYPIQIMLEKLDLDRFMSADVESDKNKIENMLPYDIPSVKFKSENFKWREFDFNHVEFTSKQTKSGMEIEKAYLVANDYSVIASGFWHSAWNRKQFTSVSAEVEIFDLGKALKDINLTSEVERANGAASFNWVWSAAPYQFSWNELRGAGNIEVFDGGIQRIEVGAGKVLGVFNLQTLLSLDFADQLSDGLAFDKAKGKFSFKNGVARTEDLIIESKVADIRISGDIMIQDRQIDQIFRVRPNLSSTMTLGSAVVAGPAVGGYRLFIPEVIRP